MTDDGDVDDNVDIPTKALRQDGFLVLAVDIGSKWDELPEVIQLRRGKRGTWCGRKTTQEPPKETSLYTFDELERQMEKMSSSVSQGEGWALYEAGGFRGKAWRAYPGCYPCAELRKCLGTAVGSAKRLL
ncbi:uncharacterized protein LOC144913564 [Branchiostoma floridae x Branchiostoma belcheri]